MKLFFRDDDLGFHNDSFLKLADLFSNRKQKLCVAAIPGSVNEDSFTKKVRENKFLEIHSHGFQHLNHQVDGKKCEFGKSRKKERVLRELQESYQKLESLFEEQYYPAFTPPWNRIEDDLLPLIEEVGFKVVSRDGDKKANLGKVTDINVDIDLHTEKIKTERTPESLLQEVKDKTKDGTPVGIMLHHGHMKADDFEFLDEFLRLLNQEGIKSFTFGEMSNLRQ